MKNKNRSSRVQDTGHALYSTDSIWGRAEAQLAGITLLADMEVLDSKKYGPLMRIKRPLFPRNPFGL